MNEVFKQNLKLLVKSYQTNRHEYTNRDSDYNETEVRTDYIDRLFECLGWDINNKFGLPPNAQEVRREKGPTEGIPDYTFRRSQGRTSALPLFFVEAKAPKESLDNKNHVFQAKSYAFSSAQISLCLVILTNFERFKVYSVVSEPNLNDPVEKDLIFDISHNEFEEKLEELSLFAKSNVVNGSLEKLSKKGVPIKMRPPVEKPFLDRLNAMREQIAIDVFRSNPGIGEKEINSITEIILNRFVFLRFAEDRRVLPPEDLLQVVRKWSFKKRNSLLHQLNKYFDKQNIKFNGRMFSNEISLNEVAVSDEVLQDVIENFYAPKCPYRFNQIRVELLGDIYEKHLGKVITINDGVIEIEDKPEVRHAKGVYYTPDYIVDEVLRMTLLPHLEKATTVEQIFETRCVDPACGSGTFLLGIYRYIHDHILSTSFDDDSARNRYLEKSYNGEWKLKYSVKRNIVEYCTHGIDIDVRAVRVSELSLYLKLLEDEPDIAKNPMPYLPSIHLNLQVGNSLIESTMLHQLELEMEDSVLQRVNPFTWEGNEKFGQIMSDGGFDCVVGNPPYIRMQILRKFSSNETDILKSNYKELEKGNPDIYGAFIVRALDKLSKSGSLGFIVSNKFTITDYGKPLRKTILDNCYVSDIVDFGHEQVFEGATTHTCILVAQKTKKQGEKSKIRIVESEPHPFIFESKIKTKKIDLYKLGASRWVWGECSDNKTLSKGFSKLGDVCEIFQGIRTSENKVFVLSKAKWAGGFVEGYSRALKQDVRIEADICRFFLRGREIGRNFHSKINQALIFPYLEDSPYDLISLKTLKKEYPRAYKYLKDCKENLLAREDGNYNIKKWYGYIYLKNHNLISKPKVMIQAMAPRANLTYDHKGNRFFVTGYGLYIKEKKFRNSSCYRFLQAVVKTKRLDSKIIDETSKIKAGYEYRKQYLKDLLVPNFNKNDQKHATVVDLQKQIETVGSVITKTSSEQVIEEMNHKIIALESDIELIFDSIYNEQLAASEEIEKVEEILARVEEQVAKVKRAKVKKKSRNKA